jgi:signal transduction histidine kinase
MTNLRRHSGSRVGEVTVTYGDDQLSVSVRDDGAFAAEDDRFAVLGHGLSLMQGRARLTGGNVYLEQPPEGGTEVRLEVPL